MINNNLDSRANFTLGVGMSLEGCGIAPPQYSNQQENKYIINYIYRWVILLVYHGSCLCQIMIQFFHDQHQVTSYELFRQQLADSHLNFLKEYVLYLVASYIFYLFSQRKEVVLTCDDKRKQIPFLFAFPFLPSAFWCGVNYSSLMNKLQAFGDFFHQYV